MQEVVEKTCQIYYLMSFSLFNQRDIQILCAYKQFVESTIIQLGEDWRIQSGLLSQQITSILSESMSAQADSQVNTSLQFNIFNQFLVPFLKDKLGIEKQACQVPDSVIQQKYTEYLKQHFQINSKITDSLTFKTLSLGFCIKAVDMWSKNFNGICDQNNTQFSFQPLGILQKELEKKNTIKKIGQKSSMGASTIRNHLSNIDLGSCQHSNSEMEQTKNKNYEIKNQKKWILLKNLDEFTSDQLQGIQNGLKKAKFSKIQVISSFASNIHQLQTNHKKVRILSINNQFYRNAFITWLIFNIKLFFSITFEQYMIYFKKLIKKWDPSLEAPLKKFYIIIEKQWNLLLKDYTVALHDDLSVLKGLISRVKNSLFQAWKAKQAEIYKKLSNQ